MRSNRKNKKKRRRRNLEIRLAVNEIQKNKFLIKKVLLWLFVIVVLVGFFAGAQCQCSFKTQQIEDIEEDDV